jgi:high-affinity iron transporter
MLATLIIVFREIMEAGLVVGIVLAATKSVHQRGLWVGYGICAGIIGACIVALFARSINSALSGFGQEFFNVAVLSIAVCTLTWHNVWMARHGRELAAQMRTVGEAVTKGEQPLMALAIVVGIAVLREGSEIVLFLYGIVISGNESAAAMMLGGLFGVIAGVGVSALTYLGLLRIPSRHLFRVTSALLALLAAGMAAQATSFLEQAQVINFMNQIVWNTSWLISIGSIPGKALHTMIGYNDRPSLIQLVVYVATLCITFALMRFFGHAPPAPGDLKNPKTA